MINEAPVEPGVSSENDLVRLKEAEPDPSAIGSKAANLVHMIGVGFPVPDGFVLRTDAFVRHTSTGTPVELPPDVVNQLDELLAVLGETPLAVRSSASAEDLPDASYAGQYETVLNVVGRDALHSAVLACWASAFNDRIRAYRQQRGDSGVPPVAVLIQPMVAADAAGVAFTANPVTGERSEVAISAVRGLGERLVSGEATPDEWIVRDGSVTSRQTIENAINAEQVLRIAHLARQVEAHFGAPQDIEWALRGNDLFLLQTRPITTLAAIEPIKPHIEIPDGFWIRDTGHFTRAISPMGRSFYGDMISNAISTAMREFGLMVDRIESREIGGYIYVRVVPPGGKEGPAPPWWLLGILVRVHPGLRAIVKRARQAQRIRLGDRLLDRWENEWRHSLMRRINDLKQMDLGSLSNAELDSQIEQRMNFYCEGNDIHFRLFVPFMKAVTDLVFFCRDELGWDTRHTMELVSGLSEMSTEPSRRLAQLAGVARGRPSVKAVLETIEGDTLPRLREIDPEFASMLDAYHADFGCRALGEDIQEPTLDERPEITLGLLKGQIDHDYGPDAIAIRLAQGREEVADEARRLLRDRPEKLARFEEVLARAQRVYPVREDNSFPTYQAPGGLLRYALIEAGERLAERGVIEDADDVWYLELPEARSALLNSGDLTGVVSRRKGEYAWYLANPGPPTYGEDPGPPPDLRAIPVEARSLMEAMMWFIESDLQTPPVAGEGIQGVGASSGTYTGPVRVIHSESEFHKLQRGDVLVCPITSPVWSVLFASAGALVTDGGGILSHAAIIAREYGIPAAVATGNATSVLKDGQIVTVDGSSGTVRVERGDD